MLFPMCVRADLAASVRSRWERGLGVQDFVPWLSFPCSAKIPHIRASIFLWSKRYSEQKWTEQLLHREWTTFYLVHSDGTVPSRLSCEHNRGDPCSQWRTLLPFWGLEIEQGWQSNSFSQNSLSTRSYGAMKTCIVDRGERLLSNLSLAFHWRHLFLKVVLALAVCFFGLFSIYLCWNWAKNLGHFWIGHYN